MAWFLAACCCYAMPVDPRRPNETTLFAAEENEAPKRWLPARIRQLEDERSSLLEKISALPYHAPKALSDHIGYDPN